MKKQRVMFAAALVLAAFVFFVSCNKETHPAPLIILNSPASNANFHKKDTIPFFIYLHDKDGLTNMKVDTRILTQDNTYHTMALLYVDSINLSGNDYTYTTKLKVDSLYNLYRVFCRITVNVSNSSGVSGKYISDFYVYP